MPSRYNQNMRISPVGLAMIRKWEGWYPKAYRDSVGVWTIGYGTTGPEARPGRSITKKQGIQFLMEELRDDEDTVKHLVSVPLNQNQFDALVSFVYNVGGTNFARSTLLKLLNRGNTVAAAGQFIRWNKARSRDTGRWMSLRGLTNRRKDEASLFSLPADYEHDESDMDMEKQPPLENPNSHESGVTTEAPQTNDNALQEVIQSSSTFKALFAAIAGVGTVATQVLEPIKDNPVAAVGLGLAVVALMAGAYIKYRDTREGR